MSKQKTLESMIAFRAPPELDKKIDRVSERLQVKRADVLRWYLEEMPEDYIPARFKH